MKRMIFYTLIIFSYHLMVLLVPLLVFLLSLSLPGNSVLNIFRWLYWPFILFSPILILMLSYRIASQFPEQPFWALVAGFFGFSPIWLAYLVFTTPWNPKELGVVLFCPIILSLSAVILAKITSKNQP